MKLKIHLKRNTCIFNCFYTLYSIFCSIRKNCKQTVNEKQFLNYLHLCENLQMFTEEKSFKETSKVYQNAGKMAGV